MSRFTDVSFDKALELEALKKADQDRKQTSQPEFSRKALHHSAIQGERKTVLTKENFNANYSIKKGS